MSGAAGSLPNSAPLVVCVSDSLWLVDNAPARVHADCMTHSLLRTSSKPIGATHAWLLVEFFEEKHKISQVLGYVTPGRVVKAFPHSKHEFDSRIRLMCSARIKSGRTIVRFIQPTKAIEGGFCRSSLAHRSQHQHSAQHAPLCATTSHSHDTCTADVMSYKIVAQKSGHTRTVSTSMVLDHNTVRERETYQSRR